MSYKSSMLWRFAVLMFDNNNFTINQSVVKNVININFYANYKGTIYSISVNRKFKPKKQKSLMYNIGLCESLIISSLLKIFVVNILTDNHENNPLMDNVMKNLLNDNVSKTPIYCVSCGFDIILDNNVFNKKQKSRIINTILIMANNLFSDESVYINHGFKKIIQKRAKYFKEIERINKKQKQQEKQNDRTIFLKTNQIA